MPTFEAHGSARSPSQLPGMSSLEAHGWFRGNLGASWPTPRSTP